MTDCAQIRPNLYLYLGGELESGRRRETERHLIGCPACRDELAAAREARELYVTAGAQDDEPGADLGIDLWPGIRAQLVAEGRLPAAPERRAASVLAGPWRGPVAALTAAAAAVVLIVVSLDRGQPTPASTGAPVATPAQPVSHAGPGVGSLPADAELAPTFGEALGEVAADEDGLRPVLRGDESLLEREWKRQRARGLVPADPGMYDVVSGRKLR